MTDDELANTVHSITFYRELFKSYILIHYKIPERTTDILLLSRWNDLLSDDDEFINISFNRKFEKYKVTTNSDGFSVSFLCVHYANDEIAKNIFCKLKMMFGGKFKFTIINSYGRSLVDSIKRRLKYEN